MKKIRSVVRSVHISRRAGSVLVYGLPVVAAYSLVCLAVILSPAARSLAVRNLCLEAVHTAMTSVTVLLFGAFCADFLE